MKRERKDQSEILRFAQNDRVFMVSGRPSVDGHERLPSQYAAVKSITANFYIWSPPYEIWVF